MLDYLVEINNLKKEKKSNNISSYYQVPEVQDIADFVGDSLGLSRIAAKTEAKIIVFAEFILWLRQPQFYLQKKNFAADLDAGCSLADSINVQQLKDWKKKIQMQL